MGLVVQEISKEWGKLSDAEKKEYQSPEGCSSTPSKKRKLVGDQNAQRFLGDRNTIKVEVKKHVTPLITAFLPFPPSRLINPVKETSRVVPGLHRRFLVR